MAKITEDRFMPCTSPRAVGDGIFFRPVRSWHSNTYAGERVTQRYGDGSGCMWPENFKGLPVCGVPLTVTHRLYWHESAPDNSISAFLSYPNAMGYSDGEYFWEAHPMEDGQEARYFGDRAEDEMEAAIKARLTVAASEPVK